MPSSSTRGSSEGAPGSFDAPRPTRKDQARRLGRADGLERDVVGNELGVDPALPYAAGDQLRILASEVQHQHLLDRQMAGHGHADTSSITTRPSSLVASSAQRTPAP